ncbi:hypothetical protein [Haloarchaeobius sp. HME9146]|uniref:hypothetical protein n=1 Tax=Haloarchaeobius sp. HME9146 TaxID=2978732 RepID=UPI0021C01FF5|nr:hypothetical protein [Haloarchaeobius sp. HME9146]MCT9095150.1 hypothetical protein [Haloarchaeobius sp. HME9146]
MDFRSSRDSDDVRDVVVCADVLGGFGVSTDAVRQQEDVPGRALEDIIADSLDGSEHPAEFVRRTIVRSDRGIDAPARHWRHAPQVQLSAVFEALDWAAELRDAHGRRLDEEGFADLPWTISLTDANGITREAPFEYPDTPLGDDNYPALIHAVNTRLLYGLGVEFVQLSEGTDRWRFALVETDELARLRDQFGLRVTVFDRPLLSAPQPPAYLPEKGGDVPLPDWVTAGDEGPRLGRDRADTADVVSSVETDVDAVLEESGASETADESDHESAAPFIDFVESDPAQEPVDESEPEPEDGVGLEPEPEGGAGLEPEPAPEGEPGALEPSADAGEGSDSFWDDTGDWVLEPVTSEASVGRDDEGDGGIADERDGGIVGEVDAEVADEVDAELADETDDGAADALADESTVDPESGDSSADDGGLELLGGGPSVSRQSSSPSDDPLDDLFDSVEESAATGSAGRTDPEYDGFDADDLADFKRGARKDRVENNSFGVGVETPTEDDRLAAYGAAIDAGGNLSVRGLLDDDTFVPTFPAADQDEVRIAYDDGCDLDAPPAAEIETDEGFVWVNADGLSLDDD